MVDDGNYEDVFMRVKYLNGVQSERSRGATDYEGLDPAHMEPIQPTPAHHYAGLNIQAPGAGLDEHGYIQLMDDPEFGVYIHTST